MLKYYGGHKVGKGTYWNLGSGERIDIVSEGVLAGDRNTAYYRLPAAGLLLLGPVIGLVYAAFLPFIGIAMMIKVIVQKVAGETLVPVRSTASFGWRPSESYFSGKKRSDEQEKDAVKEEKIGK